MGDPKKTDADRNGIIYETRMIDARKILGCEPSFLQYVVMEHLPQGMTQRLSDVVPNLSRARTRCRVLLQVK